MESLWRDRPDRRNGGAGPSRARPSATTSAPATRPELTRRWTTGLVGLVKRRRTGLGPPAGHGPGAGRFTDHSPGAELLRAWLAGQEVPDGLVLDATCAGAWSASSPNSAGWTTRASTPNWPGTTPSPEPRRRPAPGLPVRIRLPRPRLGGWRSTGPASRTAHTPRSAPTSGSRTRTTCCGPTSSHGST